MVGFCYRKQPFGWMCTRLRHFDGPCALVPRRWAFWLKGR